MRWTLVLVACACLGLFLATGRAEAQQPPGAPTIGSVTAGTNTLTVSWSAPAESGGTPITAYDLQYIRTDDDETDPANWTPLANVWTTGGTLQRVVGDLLDGLSYDLQVRARNSEGPGDWSDTHAASTNDHDFVTSRSSLVPLGSSLPGYIASGADADTFRVSVPPGGGYLWVYTTGEVDTNGVLAAGNRDILDRNEDGWLPHGVRNFSIRHSVGDGTYYFRVQGQRGSTGAYRVHARLVTFPGATAATAQTVTLGEPALGRIQLVRHLSEDNYFTFTLTATTDVAIMASGFVDVIGELRDSGQTVLGSENGSGFLGADGFLLRRSLPADTYYVRVRARAYNGAGPYVLLIDEAGDAGGSSSVAATPLPFGHPQVARISSDTEEDYYRFTLDAETYVRFLAQPLGDSFALEATLYDDQNTDLSAYTVDRADYARHGEPYAAGILEKLEAGTYTLRIKAPSGETGGPYLVFAQVDTDQAAIIAGCKATTDAQTNALTDPLSGCQWPVKNTNQYGGDGDDINIESVWAAGKLGAGVNIAIVDNGIHAGHEDLVDNIVAARNHDYYGFGPDALATHGTQVAGLIAARDNDIGIRGVAPRASIYVYNLTADRDKIADNEADAMTRHMADTAVSNNSWSFPDDGDLHSPTAAWEEAVERGVTEGFGGKGVFYVWAAGNGGSEDNSNLDGRANFYAVTAACATTSRNSITDHSERGSNLWVCAPAGYRFDFFEFYPLVTTTTTGHRYSRNQGGTSAAAAIVSGVAALVRAENPDLTWRDVKLILAASASRNYNGKWEEGARKYRSTSQRQRYWYSHNYGFGTVDAAAAVGLAAGWTTNVPPLPPLRTVEAASGPVDTPLEDAIVEDIRPGSTVSSTITLPDGYVEFIEFIEVEVTMAHPSVRDLRIVLESPSGAVSVLSTAVILDHQSPVFDGSFRFGSARHLGEDPGGTWTLRVTDRLPGHSGTFASWKIKAYGHSETAGYPPAPTATSGMRTLTIDWDAPTDIGGSAITSYDLQYIRSNASGKTDPANWTEVAGIGTDDTGTYEITGLSPGVQYDVQVRAVNDTGPGPWSESLVVRSPLEQPFAPSLTGVTPRDQGLGATWDAPTEDGGSEITSYDLRSIRSIRSDEEKEVDGNWDVTLLAWTTGAVDLQGRVASLTNGVQYDVQVRARNAIGVSDWSGTLKGTPAIQNTDASFADDTADREVAEDIAVGGNVGARVAATDPDRGDPLTYSIVGGHNLFEIDAATGQLRTKVELDADEGVTSHTLTVEVSDMLNSSDDVDTTIDDTIEVTVAVTNVNERPVVMGTTAIAHAENEGRTLAGANYSATDPEGANVNWSVGGIDRGFFAISNSGVLSFAAEPDFDARPADDTYEVTVRATEEDDGDPQTRELPGTLDVIVTLSNFDEPPEIEGPASVVDYPENSPTTRVVGSYRAADPEGAGVTWSDLSGNDAGKFDFSNTGMLTFKVSPNFEQQREYEVTLNAFDGRLTGSLTVTVTIADVNERPTISGEVLVDFTENGTGTVEMYSAMDPDVGATQDWSLAGADGGDFEITNGVLTFINPPDYDMPTDDSRPYNEYLVTVQVNDGANTATRPVTVRVLDVNEAPTVSGNATPSVDENTTAVETYSAMDPEGVTIIWSVEDPGASDFTITNAGALSFASAPNYEVKSSYTVTVRASDGTNDVPHDVTVTVTDVDEDEVLTLSLRTPLIGEEFTAAFEEGTGDNVDNVQPPTWAWARSAMGSSSGFMTISGAAAATYLPAGADRERYLRVTVSYNDGHGQGRKTLSATSEFATAATRASNMAPTFPDPLFTGSQTGLSVRENATAGTVVGLAPQATDPESRPLRYSIEVSGVGTDPPFEINATSRQIRVVRAVLDHEDQDSYSVTVTAEDEFNATATATFDITIEDVNEPPVAVADPAVTTEEDTPVTFDVLGNDTDPDEGDTLTVMTITTQPRPGRVVLDTNTQLLTYEPADNVFGTFTFTYTATDDDPVRRLSSLPAQVTVTVTPVNDPPEFATDMTTRTVSEGARPGDTVGPKVAATDVDDTTLTYSLSGASDFVIDASGPTAGQIRVAPGVTLDRENTPSYNATVTADDGKGGTDSIDVTINVSDVPEPPTAVNDTATTNEDMSVNIDVLDNDTDPDTDRARLRVSVRTQPLNGRARVESDRTITYTPNANFAGENSFTYRLSDGQFTDDGSVSVTVVAVNDAPTFFPTTAARSVPESAEADDNVGAPVTAMDVESALLTYSLSGADSGSFNIDSNGQIAVATGVTFDIATQETYVVTVTADDGSGEANASATVEVTITVTAGPVLPIIIITGGGGGGGGGGPTPSEVDFEWTVDRDIEELDGGNDRATGVWSDGTTLWVADNADGAGDAVYAYDRESGERVEEREFALHETNRAPRGFWSDRSVVWVSDSGRERLFAYDLATGERLEEREFALAAGNSDARGIWSDEETMWVLDGRTDALFAYALASGELLAEYELDSANDDPHGLWSDGVTIWVSDHGAKRLIAYRLPAPDGPAAEDAEPQDLERVRDEEFPNTVLSRASNNSPRGLWSDGDVMYVADESDDRVYSYNMPDAIDARLASLTLSGVGIGEFSSDRTEYDAVVGEGVTETTVEASTVQQRAAVTIDPDDADDTEANGHQVALQDLGEITVTVTSRDGSRSKTYRVRFPDTGWDPARDPWPHCLRGEVSEGFSLVVFEGGSIEELIGCAESRGIVALYALHEGVYVSYIFGAPDFVNTGFLELFADGLPPITPLVAASNGPPSADPFGDLEDGGRQPWPACLRGAVVAGFSLVVYEGGSVDELEACARSRDVTALYALSEGEFVSYILGAPDFVTQPFRDLFADGLPLMTPLVARNEGQPGGR